MANLPTKKRTQEIAEWADKLEISKSQTTILALEELKKRLMDPAVAYKMKNASLFDVLKYLNTLESAKNRDGGDKGVTFNVITGLPPTTQTETIEVNSQPIIDEEAIAEEEYEEVENLATQDDIADE